MNLRQFFIFFLILISEFLQGELLTKGSTMKKEAFIPVYLIPVAIPKSEFDQILEELSEIVYESMHPSVPGFLEKTGVTYE